MQILNSPNAVLGAVVLSTFVAAISGFVVVSKVLGPTDPATAQLDTTADNDARNAGGVLTPMLTEAAVSGPLGFADTPPSTARPTLLPPSLPERFAAAGLQSPVRIVEGRPSIVPPQRQAPGDAIVQVARSETLPRLLGYAAPTQRPDRIAQTAGLRPAQRPVTLSTRRPVPEAVIQQAALTPDAAPARRTLAPARSGPNPCSNRLARDIPGRPGTASDGSVVMASLEGTGGSARDTAIVQQALRGNIPGHLRDLQPVRFAGIAAGRQTEIVICVTPDYLAVGSDRDNIRVPMGLPAALRVADAFDMMLPTPRMVDAIYAQADLRLSPQPMTPGAQMSSTAYFVRHDATLDGQMASAGARDGLLVAGHKKDVVLANRLARAPGRVAIYGWHRSNGNPIQPLSTVHGEYYADYSHGVRLVSRTAYVNGHARNLSGLLTDAQYASLLNSDGPLSSSTVRLASLQ